MLPPNPLLQLVPNRIAATTDRLFEQIWGPRIELAVECTDAQSEHMSLTDVQNLRRRRIQLHETWGRLFDQRWARIVLPAEPRSSRSLRYLEWRDQGEATLYVDGEPFYGFDVAHR